MHVTAMKSTSTPPEVMKTLTCLLLRQLLFLQLAAGKRQIKHCWEPAVIFYKTSDMDEGIVTGDDVSQTRLVWVRRRKKKQLNREHWIALAHWKQPRGPYVRHKENWGVYQLNETATENRFSSKLNWNTIAEFVFSHKTRKQLVAIEIPEMCGSPKVWRIFPNQFSNYSSIWILL